MARKLERLTPLQVQRLGPGRYPDGGNLYLHVIDSGKYWFFRWGAGARSRYLSLGPIHTIGLKEAREKARQLRAQLLEGRDPKSERDARRAASRVAAVTGASLTEIIDRYYANHHAAWSREHATQWRASLANHVEPLLGALPVAAIDVRAVLKVLEPIWLTKTQMAARLRHRMEVLFDFARARGLRDGENPARWRGHLDQLLPSPRKVAPVKHFAALPVSDLAGFMDKLRKNTSRSARMLEFAILTASRIGSARQATWSEISGDQWNVPAAHMKSRRPHRVPLSAASRTALDRMMSSRQPDQYIFPGRVEGRPLDVARAEVLAKAVAGDHDLTVHGFRSTFADWAAELTNFPQHVVEMALAHAVSNQTEAAYRRGDLFEQRRHLMDSWARFCAGEAPAKVIPLSRRRRG